MVLRYLQLCALFVTMVLAIAVHASEEAPTVGYVVGVQNGEAAQEAKSFCKRAGEQIDVTDGMSLQVGDLISTVAGESLAVVFLDGSAVRMAESSSLKVESYDYPAKKASTELDLESGQAYFTVNPRPEDAHFFVHSALGKVEVAGVMARDLESPVAPRAAASTPAKFSVFVNTVNNAAQGTVGVLAGSVSLKPSGATGVAIADSLVPGTALLTLDTTNVQGGTTQTLAKGNLSKSQLSALKSNLLEEIDVASSKNGTVSITYLVNSPDGTSTTTKLKEIGGVVTSSTTTVKDGRATVEKITDTSKGSTITETDSSGRKISAKLTTGGTGTVTIKDGKTSYKGTATLVNGVLVEDATSKTGQRIVVTQVRNPDGSLTTTTTTFASATSTGVQTQTIVFPDASTKVTTLTVTNTKDPSGNFTPSPGTTPVVSTTPAKGSPPPGVATAAGALNSNPLPNSP